MKYTMKSLRHNGIYVPQYAPRGLSVKVHGTPIKLGAKTEQMVTFWVRKEQSQTSPPDKTFYKNFIRDFQEALRLENPSSKILETLKIKDDVEPLINGKPREDLDFDFSEIRREVSRQQLERQNMTKEQKKAQAQERKEKRGKLKEHFGYAFVDGEKLEIANWTAEPSCIFAGRGDHPKRGKWKEGPKEEDIILNLSDKSGPLGKWKDIVWEPESMYIAKWEDKLSSKIKYVWFADSAFLKQDMEKEKFNKAEALGKTIGKVEEHIMKNISSENPERRKLATVCWLILGVNIRVGDEKDPDEADTVGAITLRPEHIKIEGNTVHFDFLGKDAVRWVKQVQAPSIVITNLKQYSENCKVNLFEEIDSRKVSRFLSEAMEGLTAKVFRTWKCTRTVKESLERCGAKKEDPEHRKQFCAKMANLEVAKIANHKRKIPPNFDERLAKKTDKLKQLENDLQEKSKQGKKIETLLRRIDKTKFDVELTKETREYNLGTSLKSYIDPRVYVKWASQVDFSLDKLYPKTLRKKYSWALGKEP